MSGQTERKAPLEMVGEKCVRRSQLTRNDRLAVPERGRGKGDRATWIARVVRARPPPSSCGALRDEGLPILRAA